MLDIYPGLMIWTIISFVILLIVLNKAAWKPILKALDEREKGINDNIEAAKMSREDAEKALADYQSKLAEAQTEAQSIVSKARQDAERIGEGLKEKHKAEAAVIIEKAHKQIEQERDAAIKDIRSEIAGLAINAAEKVIGKVLDKEDHKRLVMEGLNEDGGGAS